MTKSKIEKKRSVELKLTGACQIGKSRMARIAKRRKLGERRAWLRALREDVVIHPGDVKPGDVIEIMRKLTKESSWKKDWEIKLHMR